MPDEHRIEPPGPEQSAQPEPPEQSEQQALPDDDAPEQPSSLPPDEELPDVGGESAGDDAGGDGADSRGVELDEVIRERDAHYDRLLRVTAEYDNHRRRTERERRELTEQATGDLLGDLLPVVDDLERALAADTEDGDAYRRGVEIIHKQLLDVMARRGVAPIEAVGTDFDPTLHQAVMHEPSDGHRDGEVVEELRRGYTLRQRLLRPSMVKVAKA